jgi:hypothetical protein
MLNPLVSSCKYFHAPLSIECWTFMSITWVPWTCPLLFYKFHWSLYTTVTSLTTIILDNQDITSQLSHEHLSFSISKHDHSCGCDHALFLVFKLSYRLVQTGWWAHPNDNLILNCAGSPRCFLRTKVARWKEHFLIGISKRPLCITRRNGWRITRGTQPKRRMLHLESCCYSKSHSGLKFTSSLKLDDHKSFLVCFKLPLDFSS